MFDLNPLTRAIGAEISGIDLKAQLPDDVVAALSNALAQHEARRGNTDARHPYRS